MGEDDCGICSSVAKLRTDRRPSENGALHDPRLLEGAPDTTNRKRRGPRAFVRSAARLLSFAFAWMASFVSRDARAIRPFITDDARVVGKGRVQLESWWRRDRLSLQHWALPAVGPTQWLEVTLGGVYGASQLGHPSARPTFAIGGPVAQAKLLLRETIPNKPAGMAIVVGGIPPAGRGGFEAPGWSGFSYLAVSQGFIKEDDLLIHANVGISSVSAPGLAPAKLTWGVGTQVETLYDFHLIAEIFSGDPYVQGAGGALQAGFRVIFNDHVQLDGTAGSGLWGDAVMPLWFSSGIRVVSHEFF